MITRKLFNGEVIKMTDTKGITETTIGTQTILGSIFQAFLKDKYEIMPEESLSMLVGKEGNMEIIYGKTRNMWHYEAQKCFAKIKGKVSFPLDLSK